jgi:hypothetical protein
LPPALPQIEEQMARGADAAVSGVNDQAVVGPEMSGEIGQGKA